MRNDRRAPTLLREALWLRAYAGEATTPGRSRLLEFAHVGACVTEQEDLHRDVHLDVRLAQEGLDGPPRGLLDDRLELVCHLLLEAPAYLPNRFCLAAADERSLGLREGLLEHHHH